VNVVHSYTLMNKEGSVKMIEILKITETEVINASETKNWYSWVNLIPPLPNDFHVIGDVLVPNLGVKAILRPTVPQGYNPQILFLTLVLVQEPGEWPQVMTWLGVRHDEIVREKPYESVTIFGGGEILGSADVEEVH